MFINKLLGIYTTKTMIMGLTGIGTIPIHYTISENNLIDSIKFGLKRGILLMTPVLSEYIIYKECTDAFYRKKNNPKTKITLLMNNFKEKYYDFDESRI